MSIENAKALLERVKNDAEFRSKMEAAGSKEERTRLAQAEGFYCTEDEWNKATNEMSDEELVQVSGGACWDCGDHTGIQSLVGI